MRRKQTKQTRIMVFGTFDVIHPGHLHFFKQARKLAKNPFLIVSVARDINVKRIKGQKPLLNERVRLGKLRSLAIVDKPVLSGLANHIPHILKHRPHIIALGYDQTAYVKNLRSALKNKGLTVKVVRLKAHRPHLYKSSIYKRRQKKT